MAFGSGLIVFPQILIKQMIALDHTARPTFDTILHTSRGAVFPDFFYSFLHNYVHSVCEWSEKTPFLISPPPTITGIPTTTPVAQVPKPAQRAPLSMSQELQGDNNLPSDSDHRMGRIWSDFESVETYLEQDANGGSPIEGKVESLAATASTSTPLQVCLPRILVCPRFLKRYSGRIPRGIEHTKPRLQVTDRSKGIVRGWSSAHNVVARIREHQKLPITEFESPGSGRVLGTLP